MILATRQPFIRLALEIKCKPQQAEMHVNKLTAVCALLKEHRARSLSVRGYQRIQKACRALGLSDDEAGEVLSLMEYYSDPATPSPWLVEALAERAASLESGA